MPWTTIAVLYGCLVATLVLAEMVNVSRRFRRVEIEIGELAVRLPGAIGNVESAVEQTSFHLEEIDSELTRLRRRLAPDESGP